MSPFFTALIFLFIVFYVKGIVVPFQKEEKYVSNRYFGKKILHTSFYDLLIPKKLWYISLKNINAFNIQKAVLHLDFDKNINGKIKISVYSKKGKIIGKAQNISFLNGKAEVKVSPEVFLKQGNDSEIYFNLDEDKFLNRVYLDIGFEKETVKNSSKIEGYTDKNSYNPNEKIKFKIHTLSSKFKLIIKKDKQILFTQSDINGLIQDYSRYSYRDGANWKTTYTFQIPLDWKPGIYTSEISDGINTFNIPFIVKNTITNSKNKILVISSTNTWNAYNDWGGASLYRYVIDDQLKPKFAQIVNFSRPNPNCVDAIHLLRGELFILSWLEKRNYSYDIIADFDLDKDKNILKKYKIVLLNTHAEYWTPNMREGICEFLDTGGSVLNLSANNIYGKTIIKDDLMEVRKIFGDHTLKNNEKGGLWRDVNKPESQILGVKYTTKGYATYAPYKVVTPHHWLFKGTNLKKGDLIGSEVEDIKFNGASGLELDKRDFYTPKNAILLAKGTNKPEGAEMIYFDHPSGGGVFSCGSITFGNGLIKSEFLTKIIQNYIERFLK